MRKYLFVMLLFLMFSSVAAQSCPSNGFMGTISSKNSVTITQTCPTCNFITISAIKEPVTSNIIVSGQNMTLINGSFRFTLDNSLISQDGTYFVEGFSNLDEPFISCFVINPSGFEFDNLWFNFLMIFLLSAGSFTLIYNFSESKNTIESQDGTAIYYYLGSFMLFAVGTYTIIFGFGGYETLITQSVGYILWGSALFFMTKPYFTGGKWSW